MSLTNWRKIIAKKIYESLPKEYQWRTARDMQHEADIHRLCMLTAFWQQIQGPGAEDLESAAEAAAASAESLSFLERKQQVDVALKGQVEAAASAMHRALVAAGDPLSRDATQTLEPSEAPQRSSSSLVATMGGLPADSGRKRPASGSGRMTMSELAAAVEKELGYSLRVAPSGIDHEEAGSGLWLDGKAAPGSVVAFYPGVTYNKDQYRHIPGYPKIDQRNSYLIGRFDGVVLDGKPWAGGDEYGGMAWPPVGLGEEPHSLDIEGRNVLALAHFANHPAAGMAPNVMVAAIDLDDASCGLSQQGVPLRRYIPNVNYSELLADAGGEAEGSEDGDGGIGLEADKAVPDNGRIAGLCLVATAHIEDEEVLLNYRFSTHVPRPSWYVPVDTAEDQRRWA